MQFEEWFDIKGYEGLYKVNRNGDVINCKTGKLLKKSDHGEGYMVVTLINNRKCKTTLVHRIVAETFLDNPEKLPCVNHKDENKSNNSVENLEWCTYKYNNRYNEINKRIAEKKKKRIVQMDLEGNILREWESIQEAKEVANTTNISLCCCGKRKTAGGFRWAHKKEEVLNGVQ